MPDEAGAFVFGCATGFATVLVATASLWHSSAVSFNPFDAPLGGKPVLPAPKGASAQRAGHLFERLVAMQRDGRQQPEQGAVLPETAPRAMLSHARADGWPAPDGFAAGRRYDATLAHMMAFEEVAGVDDADDGEPCADVTQVMSVPAPLPDEATAPMARQPFAAEAQLPDDAPVVADASADLPARPPPGAIVVRPSAPVPHGPEVIDQSVLEKTAHSAMVISEADGGSAFEVELKDALFADARCRISVRDGQVVAVFTVHDDNSRRLLEAEAGNLRVKLEGRGLRVAQVRVEVESP